MYGNLVDLDKSWRVAMSAVDRRRYSMALISLPVHTYQPSPLRNIRNALSTLFPSAAARPFGTWAWLVRQHCQILKIIIKIWGSASSFSALSIETKFSRRSLIMNHCSVLSRCTWLRREIFRIRQFSVPLLCAIICKSHLSSLPLLFIESQKSENDRK